MAEKVKQYRLPDDPITLDELKSFLWAAATHLRGQIDAAGYKEYIFPLLFFTANQPGTIESRRSGYNIPAFHVSRCVPCRSSSCQRGNIFHWRLQDSGLKSSRS